MVWSWRAAKYEGGDFAAMLQHTVCSKSRQMARTRSTLIGFGGLIAAVAPFLRPPLVNNARSLQFHREKTTKT
jgi:hypothetical protein